jgi:ribosomal protein S21
VGKNGRMGTQMRRRDIYEGKNEKQKQAKHQHQHHNIGNGV